MVDLHRRSQFATALKKLAEGELTTDRFVHFNFGKSHDPAISEIWLFAGSLFHDIYPYRLRGKNALHPELKPMVERCLLFLNTDLEYKWPPFRKSAFPFNLFIFFIFVEVFAVCLSYYTGLTHLATGLFIVGTFGLLFSWFYQGRTDKRYLESLWLAGDKDVWPFLKKHDYESAVREKETREAL